MACVFRLYMPRFASFIPGVTVFSRRPSTGQASGEHAAARTRPVHQFTDRRTGPWASRSTGEALTSTMSANALVELLDRGHELSQSRRLFER